MIEHPEAVGNTQSKAVSDDSASDSKSGEEFKESKANSVDEDPAEDNSRLDKSE